MTSRKSALAAACVVACAALPPRAQATTLLKLTVEKMSAEAAAVVVGEVTAQRSEWNAAQTAIYTYTTVAVGQCVAGACAAGTKVIVKHRGGTVGDRTLYIAGTPAFAVGQKVLLFLRDDPEGEQGVVSVYGMCQGMFVLGAQKGAAPPTAVQALGDGVALAEPSPAGVIAIVPSKGPIKMTLKKLVVTVKKARAAAKKKK